MSAFLLGVLVGAVAWEHWQHTAPGTVGPLTTAAEVVAVIALKLTEKGIEP